MPYEHLLAFLAQAWPAVDIAQLARDGPPRPSCCTALLQKGFEGTGGVLLDVSHAIPHPYHGGAHMLHCEKLLGSVLSSRAISGLDRLGCGGVAGAAQLGAGPDAG